ncbi:MULTISPECIES: hypothetical protein [Amycolatopsis]|uniref:Secreted protein n=1 Tax=Amycolatopsis bullii TaxID=941987 RepID=A0ABQ3JZ67_9PSEU|nr:hypothetical protein [Amycolatopsis bullii]GHF91428.1 hypothetical protein GCM10017567_01950 [Amycolatopsis bullii]
MVKKLATAVAVMSIAAVSLAAPADGATRYYQQTVSGATKPECDTAGWQLAQQKMAEGYLVTWIGCAYSNFAFRGTVSWSD